MDSSPEDSGYHPFIPMLILSLSVLIFLGWQTAISYEISNAAQETVAHQEQAVTQARQVQAKLKGIASGLLDLSITDEAAASVIKKYGIQHGGPGGPVGP